MPTHKYKLQKKKITIIYYKFPLLNCDAYHIVAITINKVKQNHFKFPNSKYNFSVSMHYTLSNRCTRSVMEPLEYNNKKSN
jgi:hypothetical protein